MNKITILIFFALGVTFPSSAQVRDTDFKTPGFVSVLIYISTTAQNYYQNSVANAAAFQSDEGLICHKFSKTDSSGTKIDSFQCVYIIDSQLLEKTKALRHSYQTLQVSYNSFVSEIIAEMMVTSVPKAFKIFDQSFIGGSFNPHSLCIGKSPKQKYLKRFKLLYAGMNKIHHELDDLQEKYNDMEAFVRKPRITRVKNSDKDLTDVATGITAASSALTFLSSMASTIQQNQKSRADELIGLLQSLELPFTSGTPAATTSSAAATPAKH